MSPYIKGYMGKEGVGFNLSPRSHMPSLSVDRLQDNIWNAPGINDVAQGYAQSAATRASAGRPFMNQRDFGMELARGVPAPTLGKLVSNVAEGMGLATALGAATGIKPGWTGLALAGAANYWKGTDLYNMVKGR